MKKMLFIVNPRSGREQIRGKLLDVLDLFPDPFCIQLYVTQGKGCHKSGEAVWAGNGFGGMQRGGRHAE